MLHFTVLGSGSAGNSAVVCSGTTRILIDAGLSARQLCLRLEQVGVSPDELDGIVITHEHGDHVGGLDVFLRKRKVPVYANSFTAEIVRETVRSEIAWHKFESGDGFRVGDIEIESFSVPHDAVDPVGFVFRGKRSSVGVVSDVGHVTNLVRDRLAGVDTLYVEANYDDVLLQNDTKRPWPTKQRISSRHGHLSNKQAADLVSAVASERLKRVVLGHLSQDCNEPETAANAVKAGLQALGLSLAEIEVVCARQRQALPMAAAAHATAALYDFSSPRPAVVREEAEAGEEAGEAGEEDEAAASHEQREWFSVLFSPSKRAAHG